MADGNVMENVIQFLNQISFWNLGINIINPSIHQTNPLKKPT